MLFREPAAGSQGVSVEPVSLLDGLPKKHFGCVVADPPWRFRSWNETNQHKAASRHYDLMTTHDIASLPVAEYAADDSVLLLWVSNPMLPQALWVMAAWGFEYKTVAFTWAKTSRTTQASWSPKWHMALGYWSRANTEMVLLGTRGKPKRLAKNVRQLIIEPVREHSRKPEEARDRAERLCSGPYLELFGREQRPNWEIRGNESGKFNR